MEKALKIAVFASGSGSNAQRLIEHFKHSQVAVVDLVVHNRKRAGVADRAKKLDVDCIYVPSKEYDSASFLKTLKDRQIALIVLAGFLVKVPDSLLNAFPDRIINVHPSLLPKFGGKGMYGMHVHEAVVNAGELESGISVHLVNEHFDEGRILAQFSCELNDADEPNDVQKKVQALEHTHFALVVEQYIKEHVYRRV